jgi:hypothetical protein
MGLRRCPVVIPPLAKAEGSPDHVSPAILHIYEEEERAWTGFLTSTNQRA